MPMFALLETNPFSKEFWENFSHILESAKNNPLGVTLGIIIVLSLLGVAIALKGSEKLKAQVFGGVFILAFIGFIFVGAAQVQTANPSGNGSSSKGARIGEPVTLSALVLDSKTHRPVAFARVMLATPGRLSPASTDSNGAWRVQNVIVPASGQATVYVEADGYLSYKGDIAADPMAEPPQILLDPVPHGSIGAAGAKSITLVGTVFTGNRSPVGGAEVFIESGGTPPQQEMTYTVNNGSFRFVGVKLRPDLKITVSAKGYATATRLLSETSAIQPIEIRLDPEPAK